MPIIEATSDYLDLCGEAHRNAVAALKTEQGMAEALNECQACDTLPGSLLAELLLTRDAGVRWKALKRVSEALVRAAVSCELCEGGSLKRRYADEDIDADEVMRHTTHLDDIAVAFDIAKLFSKVGEIQE